MNRKIIIPLVVLAVIIPALMVGMQSEQTEVISQQAEKIVTITTFDTVKFTFPELVNVSEVIVKGTIIDSVVSERKLNPEYRSSTIFTTHTVQIDQVLKGKINSKIIQVQVLGGETEQRISKVESMKLNDKDSVIMFLEQNDENIYGANYNLISQVTGLYVIDESEAKHFDSSKNRSLDRLLEQINRG